MYAFTCVTPQGINKSGVKVTSKKQLDWRKEAQNGDLPLTAKQSIG